MFKCCLCNKNISNNNNIYYAFDSNYCSRTCRYNAICNNQEHINLLKITNSNNYNNCKKNVKENNETTSNQTISNKTTSNQTTSNEKSNNTLKSYKSINNLTKLDFNYKHIKNYEYYEKYSNFQRCNIIIEYSIYGLCYLYKTISNY